MTKVLVISFSFLGNFGTILIDRIVPHTLDDNSRLSDSLDDGGNTRLSQDDISGSTSGVRSTQRCMFASRCRAILQHFAGYMWSPSPRRQDSTLNSAVSKGMCSGMTLQSIEEFILFAVS
jgi:hypothetical protein